MGMNYLAEICRWRVMRSSAIAISMAALTHPAVSQPINTANNRPAAVAVMPAIIPLPKVAGPIAVTESSWPWAAASHAQKPVDLAALGYVEEEFFISGNARVFDLPVAGQPTFFAQGPYTTRILVRRPLDAHRYSGTTVVEPLNPSIRYDLPIMWGESYESYIRNGDIWIGVTVKPVAIETLKQFDTKRYASLDFSNPLPPDQTCAQHLLPMPRGGLPAESSPRTENGLIWDVLSQVGALAKSSDEKGPLRGMQATHLYMVGDSQSGAFVLTYANAIHQTSLNSHGGPLYDGYLAAVATGPGTPINQCATMPPSDDERWDIRPIGVPIIVVASQSEIDSLRRRPDSDVAPDLFRGYEVAGSSHIHAGGEAGSPSAADLSRLAGPTSGMIGTCAEMGSPSNDVPIAMILNGALRNLDRWSRLGVPPPRGAPIEVINPGQPDADIKTDSRGNALGGVRTPQLDVPVARYHHRMTGPGICELWGYRKPFDLKVISSLYSSADDYQRQINANIASLVADRWIEAEDGRTLSRNAKDAAKQLFPTPSQKRTGK